MGNHQVYSHILLQHPIMHHQAREVRQAADIIDNTSQETAGIHLRNNEYW